MFLFQWSGHKKGGGRLKKKKINTIHNKGSRKKIYFLNGRAIKSEGGGERP